MRRQPSPDRTIGDNDQQGQADCPSQGNGDAGTPVDGPSEHHLTLDTNREAKKPYLK